MADVDLQIGGHAYTLRCADGEEDDLRRLAAVVDGEIAKARGLIGGMTETRQLLFAAIFLAERIGSGGDGHEDRALEPTAVDLDRLAALTDRIEHAGQRLAELAADGA